jgi:hypothetical protein
MSEEKFTEGNLIILYAKHRTKDAEPQNLPIEIHERVKTCLNTMKLIRSSKPDKNKSTILIISTLEIGNLVREELLDNRIDERSIKIDSRPKNFSETFDLAVRMIESKANPPHIYFICPFWLKDIYDSLIESKLKGYRIQFDGTPDRRPVQVVEQEKLFETPRKNSNYYKNRAKNKAIDMLLNYIFHEK